MSEPKTALDTIGTILDDSENVRDAIHIAVIPVIAGEDLEVGARIYLDKGYAYSTTGDRPVGIVDPFLKYPVKEGQKFWMCLYPRTITSLRHAWNHPDFPKVEVSERSKKFASEAWMRVYASSLGVKYDELIDRMSTFAVTGETWQEGGRFESTHIPDRFWEHFETITGVAIDEDRKEYSPFSCSC